jgi:hypothetical protein
MFGRKSPIFDIERLQLFSPLSARNLLEQTGFFDVMLLQVVNRYPLRYWLRLLPLSVGVKRSLIATLDRVGLGGWPLSIPVGNIAVIGFKPNSPANEKQNCGDA